MTKVYVPFYVYRCPQLRFGVSLPEEFLPRIFCRVFISLRAVVADLFHGYADIFEYFKQCFPVFPKCNGAMVRIIAFD